MLLRRFASSFAVAAAALAILASCNKSPAKPPVVDDPGGPHVPFGGGGGDGGSPDAGDAGAGAIATAPAAVRGVAASASDVFFIYVEPSDGGLDQDGGPLPGGVLARVAKTGGAAQKVASGLVSPRDLALVDGNLYLIDDQATGSAVVRIGSASAGAIVGGLTSSSVFVARSDVIVTATPDVGSISIDRTPNDDAGLVQNVGILNANATPVRLALDGGTTYLLVANDLGGSLYRTPLAGGVPEELWTAQSGTARDLAITSDHAYVALDRGADSQIVAIPLAGGGAGQPLVSSMGAAPVRIVVDGTDLFFATADGQIGRAPLDGSAGATLATGLGAPADLAVGSDALYVATGATVVRTSR